MKDLESIPLINEFAKSGQKKTINDDKYNNGFIEDDKIPADQMNWILNKITKIIDQIISSISNIESEIKNTISDRSIVLDNDKNNQLVDAIDHIFYQEITRDTNLTRFRNNMLIKIPSTLTSAINLYISSSDIPGIKINIVNNSSQKCNVLLLDTNSDNNRSIPILPGDFIQLINTDRWIIPDNSVQIGDIIPYGGDGTDLDYRFKLCVGEEVSKTKYPALWLIIGDKFKGNKTPSSEDMFFLPDLRECVLVGSGKNNTYTIATHDEYNIGQFKDDQFQSHNHQVGWNDWIAEGGNSHWWYTNDSRNTGGALYTKSCSGRTGDTTHGKQTGVNYKIRVL